MPSSPSRGIRLRSPRLAGLALLALGACGVDRVDGDPGPGVASSAQAVRGVAAPPASPNERIGIYVSPADTTGYAFPDLVNGPAALVTQIGPRVVRLFLSNPDKFDGASYPSLAAEVHSGPYPQLFGSSSFDTYLLTTYSAADNPGNGCAPTWLNGLSAADADAETTEIRDLAYTLGVTYPSKTFILLNWEGDSAIGSLKHYCNLGQSEALWSGFTAWINARVQGVLGARSWGVSNVFSGLEFNALYRRADDDYYGNHCAPIDQNQTSTSGDDASCARCDAGHPCVISRVAPNVPDLDYLSYSSWQSLAVPDDFQVAGRLQNDLGAAQALVPGASPANFIVGELGAERGQWGEARAATRVSNAIDGAMAWGASFAVHWQILDNVDPHDGSGVGFGAYLPGGALGSVGQMLRSKLAPSVGGVVDDSDGAIGTAHLGNYISIYGTSFGPSNLVYVGGALASTTYNGATQINAVVPTSAPLGFQTVQIYNPATTLSVFTSVDVMP